MERAQGEYYRLVLLHSSEPDITKRLEIAEQIKIIKQEIADLEKAAERRRDEAERRNRLDNSRQ
jgi:hypothetical protein